jgi:hypothetical protein
MTEIGSFPLTSVENLPNVTVIVPGTDHWSDGKASEVIVPGEAIVPINSGGKRYWRVAEASDPITQLAIALRTVQNPDPNTGPGALGPNEIMNTAIAVGEYVHAWHNGAFALTLITPDTYAPADLIGWDADGVRPAGKAGTGAWAKNAAADIDSVFEVIAFKPVHGSSTVGVLEVKSLRGIF